jgi:four helix bundle protein
MKQNPLAFQTLDSYLAAKEFARRVHLAKISDPELRDQATRAAKSTFLNLCEGLPNTTAPMRQKYFQQSQNSLYETLGAMDLAGAIGAAQPEDAAAVQDLGARLMQMVHGLLR